MKSKKSHMLMSFRWRSQSFIKRSPWKITEALLKLPQNTQTYSPYLKCRSRAKDYHSSRLSISIHFFYPLQLLYFLVIYQFKLGFKLRLSVLHWEKIYCICFILNASKFTRISLDLISKSPFFASWCSESFNRVSWSLDKDDAEISYPRRSVFAIYRKHKKHGLSYTCIKSEKCNFSKLHKKASEDNLQKNQCDIKRCYGYCKISHLKKKMPSYS